MAQMRYLDYLLRDPLLSDEMKEGLDGVEVIESTNVSNYYFQESSQEYWDLPDFPALAPPFENFWLDFRAPSYSMSTERGRNTWSATSPSHWGFLCCGIDFHKDPISTDRFLATVHTFHRDFFEQVMPQARWGLDMYLHWRQAEKNMSPLWYWRMLLDEKGRVIVDPVNKQNSVSTVALLPDISRYLAMEEERLCLEEKLTPQEKHKIKDKMQVIQDDLYNQILPFWHTALLTISFLHCRNVSLDERPSETIGVHNKNQKRRGVKPYQTIPYKVLDIYPMKEVLKKEGKSESIGTPKALHICRGHFKDYSHGRGLFGNPRLNGIYWQPQIVKGSSQKGVRVKDYIIHTNTKT